jgi:hypothetical protein
MSSEYEPLFAERSEGMDDLERVQRHFAEASRPFLSSPWSWFTWAVILPAAALLTPRFVPVRGGSGVLFLWSAAILLGGAVEFSTMLRRGFTRSSPLAAWALRAQGNLSLVAVALSALLVWQDLAWALAGTWLLLLGHSLFLLGGLAFPPFRRTGVLYQIAGLLALLPFLQPLPVFAVATAAGNAYLGACVWRERRRQG